MAQITIFSADYLVGDKPFCRKDLLEELSDNALEFIKNSISLAERKKAVLQIILIDDEIWSQMFVPDGVFLKNISEMLAKLILMSSDILILPGFEESPFELKINLCYNLKSTE